MSLHKSTTEHSSALEHCVPRPRTVRRKRNRSAERSTATPGRGLPTREAALGGERGTRGRRARLPEIRSLSITTTHLAAGGVQVPLSRGVLPFLTRRPPSCLLLLQKHSLSGLISSICCNLECIQITTSPCADHMWVPHTEVASSLRRGEQGEGQRERRSRRGPGGCAAVGRRAGERALRGGSLLPAGLPPPTPAPPRLARSLLLFNIHLEKLNLASWKPAHRVKFLATSKVFHFPGPAMLWFPLA